uniref:Trehalase n=1 Tax=Leptinotarsa decemlineata TaxID=7539 RepID=A0A1D8I2M2_LEPDE|nr:trehalase 2 [Leptinotarsa decemlineata]
MKNRLTDLVLLSVVLTCIFEISMSDEALPPPCSSEIYCHGRLLHTIQSAKIYEDSKTFVDMKMKVSPKETLHLFEEFMAEFEDKPTRNDVIDFVNENFEKAGQEFGDWMPSDWVPHPKFIDVIGDPVLKEWVVDLNSIWKKLGRKMKNEVKENEELYSIIWVPNPVIVPGGRFREFYYWDSYWIIQGLLLSEMHDTARGMLGNLLYMVDNYGLIPNGGRLYYLARSQPPLLLPMIKLYLEFTNDINFIKDNIHIMEKEFDFWVRNHTKSILVDGVNYTLALYGDSSTGPRPESYSEDVESASVFKDDAKKEAFYSELKAAAESGWDFSSRWFVTDATNKGNLTNIKTRSIVPVDLNALMYWNAAILAEFHELLNNKKKAANYSNIASEWMKAVEAVLWHEEIGSWLDYDIVNEVRRDYFHPSNIAPLWTGCYDMTNKENIVRSVLHYLENKNFLYPGGIPSTVEHTGEQWDFPNAWPPLQHIVIVGLNNTGEDHAVRLAYEIAEKWIRSNYKAYNETKVMYEKYDASIPGGHGGGGEYEVQEGFGWTNGIIMDLLYRYSDKLTVVDPRPAILAPHVVGSPANSSSSINSITTALIALLVSLSAGFIGWGVLVDFWRFLKT